MTASTRAAFVVASALGISLPLASCGAAPRATTAVASSASSSQPPVATASSAVTSVASAPLPSASTSATRRSEDAVCADASGDLVARKEACDGACATARGEACATLGDLEAKGPPGDETEARAALAYDRGCKASASRACAAFAAIVERARAACAAKTPAPCLLHGKLIEAALAPTPQDLERADASLKIGCDAKLAEACELRAGLLARGDETDARLATMQGSYARACDLGRATSCCAQAAMVETGMGVRADEKRASALRERAKKGGDADCTSVAAQNAALAAQADALSIALLTSPDGTPVTNGVLRNGPIGAGTIGPVGSATTPAASTSASAKRAVAFDVDAVTLAPNVPGADAVVAKNKWRFRACALKAYEVDANAGGKLRVTVSIGADGRVSGASGSGGTPASLATCVAGTFHSMSFPAPDGGSATFSVTVTLAKGK
jgi:TPR repeat protein